MRIFLLFFLIWAAIACPGFGQKLSLQNAKDGFSLSWFSYVSVAQQFSSDLNGRLDVTMSSIPRVSYAGKFEYNGLLNKHLEVSIGVSASSYPTDFVFAYDSIFSLYGKGFDDYSFERYSGDYLGVYGAVDYRQQLSVKDFLSLRLGLNIVYFIPAFYGTSSTSIQPTGQYKFFEARANMNPKGLPFLAPELSLRYYHLVWKKYMPFISINGVYSSAYPINGNYLIFGKNETVQGTFRRRFLHAGIEVGVKYNHYEQGGK